ncbi:MAG: hypothetical protein GY941_08265 [Planctomycetes bacterium]|nr:hypothetical protein [Planctomycetota bacterium]
MGAYIQLFSITAEHLYFSDGICKGLKFVPSENTTRLIEKTGVILKSNDGGITLLFDKDRADALRLYVDDPVDPLSFCFKVYSLDSNFFNYTLPTIFSDNSIISLHNNTLNKVLNKKKLLHRGEFITEDDFVSLDSPIVENAFTDKDKLVKPHFIITVDIVVNGSCLLDRQNSNWGNCYFLRFKNRSTFWKYILMNKLCGEDRYVAGINTEIEFGMPTDIKLDGVEKSMEITSRSMIPLQERSDYIFQLREKKTGNGKVLIKHLPVATAENIFKEVIDKKGDSGVEISKIFINL